MHDDAQKEKNKQFLKRRFFWAVTGGAVEVVSGGGTVGDWGCWPAAALWWTGVLAGGGGKDFGIFCPFFSC
jgi:hypothetical protein